VTIGACRECQWRRWWCLCSAQLLELTLVTRDCRLYLLRFVGVGIQIRHDDRRDIQVVNPLEGGPAFRGGVENDDRIVAVDGKSTVGWTLNKAVDSITGPAGNHEYLLWLVPGSPDDNWERQRLEAVVAQTLSAD
jgi:hypothetical protein